MKIILLKDVPKVGRKYDIKDVADGYALNMLIPRGLAQTATPVIVEKMEKIKSRDLTQKKIEEELLAKNLNTIKDLSITIKEKSNEKGHLFKGVTKEVLVEEILKSTRFKIDPESIILDKPIKEVGDHKVSIEAMGKRVEFNLHIEGVQ